MAFNSPLFTPKSLKLPIFLIKCANIVYFIGYLIA
jgi:hypothetical protein